MDSLYNIKGRYQELYEMLSECADDSEMTQIIMDTLEGVQGELEVKIANCIEVIKQCEMEGDECEKNEAIWGLKKQQRRKVVDRLKNYIKDALITTGNEKGIPAGDYTVKVVKNGGVAPIIYDHEEDIPQTLMRVKYEKDAKLIREYLEKHPDTAWAHIGERGTHLAIK